MNAFKIYRNNAVKLARVLNNGKIPCKGAELIHDERDYSDGKADGILTMSVSEAQKYFDQMYIMDRDRKLYS